MTYGQTEILLLFGKIVGEADVRDVHEMTASNVGFKMFISSTFIGNELKKLSSTNRNIIHKKVHSNNLFLALFVILVIFHPEFL